MSPRSADSPAPKGRSRRNFAGVRPVMDDVARMAGVSKQTVSRVLNDHPAVRDETREAVRDAMRVLGYRPSASARSLASGRTRMVGVISFDAARYGPASILTAINTAAQKAGYLLSSIALDDTADHATVAEAVQRLSTEGADGVIALAPQHRVGQALAETRLGTPLVVMENEVRGGTPLATADSRGGARKATVHLLELGHATVWHIAGPAGWTSADQRVASWQDTLKAAGGEIHPPLVGDWSAESGYELGRELARRPDVTAVFASNDQMALGLLHALQEAGRRVPDDISVVGYDDIPEAAHFLPPLTTVRTDFAEIGTRLLRLLLDRIDGRAEGGETGGESMIPVELVVRRSSGAPPRR
ncbi:LacI family DNA-binding transcriptional regulator [Streptomyces justiciae]|uniref:LacI family DNA-binding transcriptional regulator n=1 Tax=Streptomyces justiciae TaxID=2780140 RepID=A0ABU3M1N8_9ACTN|nr:LacI family DNA-binding transcriptional regulator [Streptomyces justiciae]MDT7845424.1 LacI family DNA-binding transcriptional regulator [Streptomyces justiciae]